MVKFEFTLGYKVKQQKKTKHTSECGKKSINGIILVAAAALRGTIAVQKGPQQTEGRAHMPGYLWAP